MDSKELYELHKGKRGVYGRTIGVVCGWNREQHVSSQLIIAVGDMPDNESWHDIEDEDVLESNFNNPNGYFYVNDTDIID